MTLCISPTARTGSPTSKTAPGGHSRRALRDIRCVGRELVGDLADGEDRGVGGAQVVRVQVVGVDVGHQHRGRAVHRVGLGEDARVEDHDAPLVLDPDAGVAELGDPHGPDARHTIYEYLRSGGSHQMRAAPVAIRTLTRRKMACQRLARKASLVSC